MHRNLWVTSGWDQRFCHLHFQCFGGQHSAARIPTSTSTATSGGNSQLRRNRSSSFGCRMAYGPSLCCRARPGMFTAFSWHTKAVRKAECPFCAAYRPRTTSIPARTAAMCLWGSRPTSSVSTDLSIETISTGRLKPAVEPTGASRSAHRISPCWITIPPVAGRRAQRLRSSECRTDLH